MAHHLYELLSSQQGRLAQLVEHLVYTERVSGSSPLAPTIIKSLMIIADH